MNHRFILIACFLKNVVGAVFCSRELVVKFILGDVMNVIKNVKNILLNALLAAGLFAISNCSTGLNDPCPGTPSPVGLTASSSTSLSHNAGQDCLSCHGAGGSAISKWAVAGSVANAKNSTTVASSGTKVSNIGGAALVVDKCGNFYAKTNSVTGGQPKAAGGTMNTTMQSTYGSCNMNGCHDGSSTAYVY